MTSDRSTTTGPGLVLESRQQGLPERGRGLEVDFPVHTREREQRGPHPTRSSSRCRFSGLVSTPFASSRLPAGQPLGNPLECLS